MDVDFTHVALAFGMFLILRKLLIAGEVAADFSRVPPQTMDNTMAQGPTVTSDGPYVKGR